MEINWSEIIQQSLLVIIQVLLPIALVFIINWIRKQSTLLETKISAEQLELVRSMVSQLVLAAEQVGLKDSLLAAGDAKKEWVLMKLEEQLSAKGINIDLNILSDEVEAAVHRAFKLAGQG